MQVGECLYVYQFQRETIFRLEVYHFSSSISNNGENRHEWTESKNKWIRENEERECCVYLATLKQTIWQYLCI